MRVDAPPRSAQSETMPLPESLSELNVALCHDWLTGMRGGERVLELLCRAWPRAPLHTLLANRRAISSPIRARRIETSWLQRVPGIDRHYRHWLPFFPGAIEGLGPLPPEIDVLISTSHCVAKGLPTDPATKHLCYCFTPMRYAWVFEREYLGWKAPLLRPLLGRLRRWDRRTAERVDRFVAISEHVRGRIERFYGRGADVVYPPVDTEFFTVEGPAEPEDFDLIVSALVPYKRVDLAVAAYKASGRRLVVVGVGGEMDRLRASAADSRVEFRGRLPDEEIRALYRRCRLLVFPGEEDFGIVPLEAMACGRPVVAFGRGGALETVADGVSGLFFRTQEPADLNAAVARAADMDWDRAAIRAQSVKFEQSAFLQGLSEVLTDLTEC